MKTPLHCIEMLALLFVGTNILAQDSPDKSPAVAKTDFRVLHHFAGGDADGAVPLGGLIQSGSTLYGMTKTGGSQGNDTIFRINADGTGFQLMHSFVSGDSDGQYPYGSLFQSGSILYGMAGDENTSFGGTLFQIGTDGTGFKVLHRFAGPPSDGRWPYGSVIQSGSALYGMTVAGGSGDTDGNLSGGTVFRINTDGKGYRILHHFTGGSADGSWSAGNLTLIGKYLYGMTYKGGSNDLGTIFRIGTDGTGFELLRSFSGAPNDGARTHDSFTQFPPDPALYGMTGHGGTNDKGTLFKINTDGKGFHLLHSFDGGANDDARPPGARIKSESLLYGTTKGKSGNGAIFSINTDGSAYWILHDFTGADGAGASGVFRSGSTLYGMTWKGGSQNKGVIFALSLPESSPRSATRDPETLTSPATKDRSSTDVPSGFPALKGPYLGQQPPGLKAEPFAPAVLSIPGKNHHTLSFSADGKELYFSRYPEHVTMVMRQVEGVWQPPEAAPFPGWEAVFAPDGKSLVVGNGDLFRVGRISGGWGQAEALKGTVNTKDYEYYASSSMDGILYFTRRVNGRAMILHARQDNGLYPAAEELEAEVNGTVAFHPFVAPDESYLLFNSPRAGSYTKNDIWISIRQRAGAWSAPVNLGPRINCDAMAVLCPIVSPDGKYLFFTKMDSKTNTGFIYWVSTKVIDDIKKEVFNPKVIK